MKVHLKDAIINAHRVCLDCVADQHFKGSANDEDLIFRLRGEGAQSSESAGFFELMRWGVVN